MYIDSSFLWLQLEQHGPQLMLLLFVAENRMVENLVHWPSYFMLVDVIDVEDE